MKYKQSVDRWTKPEMGRELFPERLISESTGDDRHGSGELYGDETASGEVVPAGTDPAVFGHLSFALIRTVPDRHFGEVVACRTPDRSLTVGTDFSAHLREDPEGFDYLRGAGYALGGERPPLFVRTAWGLGLLSPRYDVAAGVGLYLHIHARPAETAGLIRSGALGDGENRGLFRLSEAVSAWAEGTNSSSMSKQAAASYRALADAWATIEELRDGLPSVDENRTVAVEELLADIRRWARFVGCGATIRVEQNGTVRRRIRFCDRRLFEALLIARLAEIRDCAADRRAVCVLTFAEVDGTDGGGFIDYGGDTANSVPVLRWCWDVLTDTPSAPADAADPIDGEPPEAVRYNSAPYVSARAYMDRVAELGGFEIHRAWGDPVVVDADAHTVIRRLTEEYRWLRDPSAELNGDLKAGIVLRADD